MELNLFDDMFILKLDWKAIAFISVACVLIEFIKTL